MKKIALIIATLAVLSGCNTLEGIGKDVREAGTKIEESSKRK